METPVSSNFINIFELFCAYEIMHRILLTYYGEKFFQDMYVFRLCVKNHIALTNN